MVGVIVKLLLHVTQKNIFSIIIYSSDVKGYSCFCPSVYGEFAFSNQNTDKLLEKEL